MNIRQFQQYKIRADHKTLYKNWITGEWDAFYVFCSSHYEDQFYVCDDFGNLVKTAYTWLTYSNNYTSSIRFSNFTFKAL